MARHLLIILSLLCLVPPARAEEVTGFVSGNELLKWCTEKDPSWCTGYVAGVSDELSVLVSAGGAPAMICKPEHVTLGQLHDVVTRYLQTHPERAASPASALVYIALRDVWPCKRGR